VASGYREMSLETEAAAVAEVMAAADVQVEADITCGRLHPLVDTVLATALREGVTNILRHSKVQSCAITAAVKGETVRLTLVNDGVVSQEAPRTGGGGSGSGLGNLRTRLTEIGGRLTTETTRDGRFRLVAEAPVKPVTVDAPDTGEPPCPSAV
jgi:two-component system sensor histidine kinase DesK